MRTYAVPLRPRDRLAIDSDGVHDNLTRAELNAALCTAGDAQEVADVVAARARDRAEEPASPGMTRPKQDDISVIVLSLSSGS